MAITARFEADFTQFNAAVDAGDVKLRNFTGSSGKADSGLRLVKGSSVDAGNSFGQLSQGLSSADKTLAAFGLHLGPQIHALDEMSQAAGRTASDIGLIGTASLTAAAALGGWELGRTIAKFFDLDNAIANTTARWMGYGDVIGETGLAKQDSINLAISRGASAHTDYAGAIRFNHDWVIKHTEAMKEQAKAVDREKKAVDDATEAQRRLTEAQAKHLNDISGKLFGVVDIQHAKDYMAALVDITSVSHLNNDALTDLNETLTAGISRMVEQGRASDDLTNQMEQWRIAVIKAQESHTVAITKMETDEERFARENAELAKAMQENFVVIGQSAAEAAAKVSMSFSDALDAARRGQGTLTGMFQSIAPGAAGSSIRYDDYGNPYGYIPGVNLPGNIAPPSRAGSFSVVVNAQNSFFDTPAGQQRLADKVGSALVNSYTNQGGLL